MSAITAKEINGKAMSREALLEFIETSTKAIDLEYPVDIKITKHTGLLDCYAVFWIWMRHLTEVSKERWPTDFVGWDNEGHKMHKYVCQLFLGKTKAFKIGKTLVDEQQKTLTSPKMNKGELIDLLRRIDEWSISLGIALPQPESEYTEAR